MMLSHRAAPEGLEGGGTLKLAAGRYSPGQGRLGRAEGRRARVHPDRRLPVIDQAIGKASGATSGPGRQAPRNATLAESAGGAADPGPQR
jgi:hypothetical protein